LSLLTVYSFSGTLGAVFGFYRTDYQQQRKLTMSAPSLAWKAFDFMLTGLREDLGQPVRLRRLLAAPSSLAVSLPAPPLSVAAGSIVQWHEWGPRDGALVGWRALGGHYGSFRVPLPTPYAEVRAVLLPKDEGRSRRAAAVLREAGALDLGMYLTELVSRQARFV